MLIWHKYYGHDKHIASMDQGSILKMFSSLSQIYLMLIKKKGVGEKVDSINEEIYS